MQKVDISFVIPFYKKEATIEKCLKHLFDQSIKDFEVVLVKDGPDAGDLSAVKKKYSKRKNFHLIELGVNVGACGARNAGFLGSQGRYVSFWDADSYIKPDAAATWLKAFKKFPDVDFVYAGYEFPEGQGAMPTESFDPWLLEVNNYISGHYPVRREKVPKWDANLKSLQDWDYWLQIVRGGSKGMAMQGYSFVTEFPDENSISGQGCVPGKWLERLNAVREKHGIKRRKTCVSSLGNRPAGIALAKVLDADYRDMPGHIEHEYETIVQLGFNPHKADEHGKVFFDPERKVKKVLFWTAENVQSIYHEVPLGAAQALKAIVNGSVAHQFCEDHNTAKLLEDAGFKVSVLPLHLQADGVKVEPLPKEFKVLLDNEKTWTGFFDGIIRAMPDVKFVTWEELGNRTSADEFSLVLHFDKQKSVTEDLKRLLVAGRRVISNIQAPFCGYVSERSTLEELRVQIVKKVREAQAAKGPDSEAADYYFKACSPSKFKDAFVEEVK